MSASDAARWALEPGCAYLNHGSFGAAPRRVLSVQRAIRDEMERQPARFFTRRLEPLLAAARGSLASFVGASADDLVFVRNATEGVNVVLSSFPFTEGDELLMLDHTYNACANAMRFHAASRGARVVVARLGFPIASPQEVIDALSSHASERTRLVLIDQVTSPTALVLPVREIVARFEARGVAVLVDAAHAPGMVEMNLDATGASFTTGNLHKWVCAPKGAAFLHARRDRRALLRPLVISHGANSARSDLSRFHLEFDWTGTFDPSAILSVPAAIEVMGAMRPGGWPELRAENHAKVVAARRLLLEALSIAAPCPDEMLGSMASLPISLDPSRAELANHILSDRHGVEVPVIPWSSPEGVFLRISAQVYNREEDYARLASALRAEGISGR